MMNPMNLGCHLLNPKKHADKTKHKVRSRYVSSSSEEDQSSVARHRYSKPSGALSDQDQPQHDPDPPYYREVALSDVPSQYAEEVDTFRCIPCLGPQLQLWVWTMKKAIRSSDHQEKIQELNTDFAKICITP